MLIYCLFVVSDNFVKFCFDGGLPKDRALKLTLESVLVASDMSIQKLGCNTEDPDISRLIAGWADSVSRILAQPAGSERRREVILIMDALDELESVLLNRIHHQVLFLSS